MAADGSFGGAIDAGEWHATVLHRGAIGLSSCGLMQGGEVTDVIDGERQTGGERLAERPACSEHSAPASCYSIRSAILLRIVARSHGDVLLHAAFAVSRIERELHILRGRARELAERPLSRIKA